MEPVFCPFCPRFRTLPTFVTRWFRVTKNVPVLRVDHVTLERILPRVWEIVSSGVPMVKRCNGAKVYLHSDSILILYAIVGLRGETLSAPVLGQGGGTQGVIVRDQLGHFWS